jgi:hypothetical protein
VTWIGVDVWSERIQNVNRVFRIAHRVSDLGVGKSEIFSDFGKFFAKIIVPGGSAGAVRWEIGFAHRCNAPADRCTRLSAGTSIPFPPRGNKKEVTNDN